MDFRKNIFVVWFFKTILATLIEKGRGTRPNEALATCIVQGAKFYPAPCGKNKLHADRHILDLCVSM
jgi:hypothetical protein